MSTNPAPLVRLNDHLAQNWKPDAGPVAILNVASTTHERIAYCWGIAEQLDVLADLGIASDDYDVSRFAVMVSSAIAPLLAVLSQLGDESFETEKGNAS